MKLTRRRVAASAGAAFAGVVAAGLGPWSRSQRLVVADEDGRTLLTREVEEGSEVRLEYTHSVEKTEVVETYLVDDGELAFDRIEFHSFGAGLPTGPVERNEDGAFVYTGEREPRSTVTVSTGHIAGHDLVVDGERIPLVERAEGGTVHLTVERSPWIPR